jgi:hypothetical protein
MQFERSSTMNIRSLILAAAIALLSPFPALAQTTPAATTTALAVADIDGIWAIPDASITQQQVASYFSIRAAPSGLLVIIRLGTYDWQAFVTTLSGNSATVTTLTTQAINSWRIDFASAAKATITGVLCISNGGGIQPMTASPSVGTVPSSDVIGMPIRIGNQCFIPQGTVLTLTKVL